MIRYTSESPSGSLQDHNLKTQKRQRELKC